MRVYNTLSGKKEEFIPQGAQIKMYVCGVTPYDESHIGHAMSYISFDVIRRYLQFRGYQVKYVQNITDVEDKLIERANRLGVSVRELAEKFTASYFADMDALNIERADIYPRATEEIAKIIEVIRGLIDNGNAYATGGSVYFRVKQILEYGKLSHRSPDSMISAEGAIGSDEKESPLDFALWKAMKPGEPWWESPWGKGRPGWHIECSAIAIKHLGDTIDIHGGGQDLIFPHHENEMTQSESFTGKKPFVKYWLHNGMLKLGEEKMSKSLGNLVSIKEVLAEYSADAIRIFALSSHYRSPLTYSEEALESAEKGADRLRQAVHGKAETEKGNQKINIKPYRQRFIKAMDDDFNTAQALAAIFNLARKINNSNHKGLNTDEARVMLKELSDVLGLTLDVSKKPPLDINPFLGLQKWVIDKIYKEKINKLVVKSGIQLSNENTVIEDASEIISWLINLRNTLRQYKKFFLADEIREKLDGLGITLEDTQNETVYKRKR
jgi:cysteinyl-tRNA synthetase